MSYQRVTGITLVGRQFTMSLEWGQVYGYPRRTTSRIASVPIFKSYLNGFPLFYRGLPDPTV